MNEPDENGVVIGDPADRPLWKGDVVELKDADMPRMTVMSIRSIGGEDAYECHYLYDGRVLTTWHRRSELKAI